MKNKNFVPKETIERVLYNNDIPYYEVREDIVNKLVEEKPFLEHKYREVYGIVSDGKFNAPHHNIKRYIVNELFDKGHIRGAKIPMSRAHYYLVSIYLAEMLGIDKKPTGKENIDTIKNGIFLLMLEFDITSQIKFQELQLKLLNGVLTGQGPITSRKQKVIGKDLRGGNLNG